MKRLSILILAVCLLLTGCGWLDGSYYSVTPHRQHGSTGESEIVTAGNYLQLRMALEEMVSAGVESSVISVEGFRQEQFSDSMALAVRYVKNSYPIGAYAVEEITYEEGTIGGDPAVAVTITYRHARDEIQSIRPVADMEEARALIGSALTQYEAGLVLLIGDYTPTDIHQLVDDYVADNPGNVMETPELTTQLYPNTGRERVLELKFSYQSSRDSLRSMQELVQRIFNSAALYVSHDAEDAQKLSQLYSFLMERFNTYQIKTSITPAYSLLNHGVGDSNAFAVVYAEMCQRAGVECHVVVGTRGGEPWCWNIVKDGEYYYHVDLLECQYWGSYQVWTDPQMTNYVWDYSAYPACTGKPAVTEPVNTEAPEPTANTETQVPTENEAEN